MFDPQGSANSSPNNFARNNGALPNTKTPPPVPANAGQLEPEDIFKNVDPAPMTNPPNNNFLSESAPLSSEPVIKNAPSIFNQSPAPKNIPATPAMVDVTAPPKTLDTKSIVLLVIIAILIIATVAAAIWWFLGYQKNKNINANNSPAVNLFNSLNNTPADNTNAANENINENTNLPAPVDTSDNNNTNTPAPNSNLPVANPNPDADGDGLTNEEEISLGTSISAADTDNDGLSDREEVKIYKTDPLKPDTDADGYTDGDEIENKKDPLKTDVALESGVYSNNSYKFLFTPLASMVLASAADNIVLFNDDVNQIKLYIYLDGSEPVDMALPDFSYLVAVGSDDFVYIKNLEKLSDQTPYSTEYSTQKYEAANSHFYTIRYIATKRADNHQTNFETILKSFKFLP